MDCKDVGGVNGICIAARQSLLESYGIFLNYRTSEILLFSFSNTVHATGMTLRALCISGRLNRVVVTPVEWFYSD